jgi:hypothetical protein
MSVQYGSPRTNAISIIQIALWTNSLDAPAGDVCFRPNMSCHSATNACRQYGTHVRFQAAPANRDHYPEGLVHVTGDFLAEKWG